MHGADVYMLCSSLYVLYVFTGRREMSLRRCPRGQTHSKTPQSSVLNLRVAPLHLARRQQSVCRLALAVSAEVVFTAGKQHVLSDGLFPKSSSCFWTFDEVTAAQSVWLYIEVVKEGDILRSLTVFALVYLYNA